MSVIVIILLCLAALIGISMLCAAIPLLIAAITAKKRGGAIGGKLAASIILGVIGLFITVGICAVVIIGVLGL